MKNAIAGLAFMFVLVVGSGTLLSQKAPATAPAVSDRIKVVGLSVRAPDPADKSAQSGTTISCRLTAKNTFFISLDDSSKIESFKDDKGTDLAKAANMGTFSPFVKISDDGQSVRFDLRSDAAPAAGATAINIKGKVVFTVGGESKTDEQADVELKQGAKLSVGGLRAAVETASVSKMGKADTLQVTLTNDKGFNNIKSISIVGADGKAVKGEVVGYANMGESFSRTYSFATGTTKGKLCVEHFPKMEKKEIPIDLKVTVGL